MSMTKRLLCTWLVAAGLAAASTIGLGSCERDDAVAPPPRAAAAPAAPAPAPLPIAAQIPGEDQAPDGGQSSDLIVPSGEWTESKTYKFRLDRISACGIASQVLGPAAPAAAGGVGQLRGETSWVGAYFSVEAKEPSVFVTPRDLELRRGGVILTGKHINLPVLSGCQPLLAAKQLRKGEALSGYALFEVPKSFRVTTEDPIVLSYRPTRWGGARRVDVPIRECLDACRAASTTKPTKTAGRNSPAKR
jgi:hypothetical protein